MKIALKSLLLCFLLISSVDYVNAQYVRYRHPVPRTHVVIAHPPAPRRVWVTEVRRPYRPYRRNYRWHSAYWAPRSRAVWVPGYWTPRRRGNVWIPGHWR